MEALTHCMPATTRHSTWGAQHGLIHTRPRRCTRYNLRDKRVNPVYPELVGCFQSHNVTTARHAALINDYPQWVDFRVRSSSKSVAATARGIKLPEDFLDKLEEQISKEFFPSVMRKREPLPITVQFADSAFMLGNWALLREAVVVDGEFTRAQKETLAAFVSKSNDCTFCANGHRLFALVKGADDTLNDAYSVLDPSLLSDERMGEIIAWMVAAQQKNSPVLEQAPPFSFKEAPELLGTAFMFNHINRVVDTYITQDEFLPMVPGWIKFFAKFLPFIRNWYEDSVIIKPASQASEAVPGEFLKLVKSDILIPGDLEWMSGKPYIQLALAMWCMAWDDLGGRFMSISVRQFVSDYIRKHYDGSEPPLSRKWVFEVAEKFDGDEAERSAIRFMLLIAFARFQIDDEIMSDLEKYYPDQDSRDALGIWVAFRTAATIMGWQTQALEKLM